MKTLELINFGSKLLREKKIPSYILDSELLLSEVLSLNRENILINLNKKLKKKKFNQFKELILRRKNYEPIAYIIKKKEFWKHDFIVNKEVLIPRSETEIIVNKVLNLTKRETSKQILDVGTGSGCIMISLIKERPRFKGTAIDICKNALNVAISNAKIHHLENKIKFVNMDIDKLCSNKYDLIVSNPPYINDIDLKRLDNNIKLFEPVTALKAGIDGLNEIRKLIKKSKNLLKINGKLIFEIGKNQVNEVRKILYLNNFYLNEICKDIQSYPRVIVSTKLS